MRASKRLVGSPAVVVESDTHMTTSMRRVMKMMNRGDERTSSHKPDLEINPDHAMMVRLEKMRHQDAALAQEVAEQILRQCAGRAGLLEDPRAMLSRLNSLLEKLLTQVPSQEATP